MFKVKICVVLLFFCSVKRKFLIGCWFLKVFENVGRLKFNEECLWMKVLSGCLMRGCVLLRSECWLLEM